MKPIATLTLTLCFSIAVNADDTQIVKAGDPVVLGTSVITSLAIRAGWRLLGKNKILAAIGVARLSMYSRQASSH